MKDAVEFDYTQDIEISHSSRDEDKAPIYHIHFLLPKYQDLVFEYPSFYPFYY